MALLGNQIDLSMRIGPGVVLPLCHSHIIRNDAIWSADKWGVNHVRNIVCKSCIATANYPNAAHPTPNRCEECGLEIDRGTICQLCTTQASEPTLWLPLPSQSTHNEETVSYRAFENYF
jgi:hypothetical protein